jgi:hypothetical protein
LGKIGVQARLDRLGKSWRELDILGRSDEVRWLLVEGCTGRGLADALRCSQGTIRRYGRIARLSPQARQEIVAGASPTYFLRQEAEASRLLRRYDELAKEQPGETEPADVVARLIACWCLKYFRGVDSEAFIERLIGEAERRAFFDYSRELQARGVAPIDQHLAVIANLIIQCRPVPKPASRPWEEPLWIEWDIKWLALWTARVVFEHEVRYMAFRKAQEMLCARAREEAVRRGWRLPPFIFPQP